MKRIAETIVKEICQLRENDTPLPFKLTLSDIATNFNASVTPVLEAIDELISGKVIHKKANGRLELLPYPKEYDPEKVFQNSGLDIQKKNQREIVVLSIKGSNVFLREQAFADRYGVGRTVIRRIFSENAWIGLLQHMARRGWKVHPFQINEMKDYLMVREMMEVRALHLAGPHLEVSVLEKLFESNRNDKFTNHLPEEGDKPNLDDNLHEYLIEKSGNIFIQRFFKQYGHYYKTLFNFATPEMSLELEMADQHRGILLELLGKNWNKAADILTLHIQRQEPIMENLLNSIQQSSKELKYEKYR